MHPLDVWKSFSSRPYGSRGHRNPFPFSWLSCGFDTTAITGRKCLQVGDSGDDLAADDLQRSDLVHVRDDADYRFDAHASEPVQLPDQLPDFLAILADIEGECAGLLDLLVVPALDLAVPAQDIELLGYF